MHRGGITTLRHRLDMSPVTPQADFAIASEICGAVDKACMLYFKNVLCLQRAAVTTIMLRQYGFPAELVVAAQIAPPKYHAWVELDGVVVNDLAYVSQIYIELDRFRPNLAGNGAL